MSEIFQTAFRCSRTASAGAAAPSTSGFEQRVECMSVGAELTEMLSGSALGELALAQAFVIAKHARSLQVPHNRGIGVLQRSCVHGKCRQHFRQGIRRNGPFPDEAAKIFDRDAQVLRYLPCFFRTAFP